MDIEYLDTWALLVEPYSMGVDYVPIFSFTFCCSSFSSFSTLFISLAYGAAP